MNNHAYDPERGEYRLSSEAARSVTDRTTMPPRRRQFLSTEHLSTEAIAAYVDRRLPASAEIRAHSHLADCPECGAEVQSQRQARRALRESGPIPMPDNLRQRLGALEEQGPINDRERGKASGSRDSAGGGTRNSPGSELWARLLRRLGRDYR